MEFNSESLSGSRVVFAPIKPVYRHEESAVPCVSVFKYADVRYVCRNDNDFSFQGIANQDKPLVGGETLFRKSTGTYTNARVI